MWEFRSNDLHCTQILAHNDLARSLLDISIWNHVLLIWNARELRQGRKRCLC